MLCSTSSRPSAAHDSYLEVTFSELPAVRVFRTIRWIDAVSFSSYRIHLCIAAYKWSNGSVYICYIYQLLQHTSDLIRPNFGVTPELPYRLPTQSMGSLVEAVYKASSELSMMQAKKSSASFLSPVLNSIPSSLQFLRPEKPLRPTSSDPSLLYRSSTAPATYQVCIYIIYIIWYSVIFSIFLQN